jgi:hypothetical protein
MATATAGTQDPFSIFNFRRLFNNSTAKKYLTRYEVDQIAMAVEQKDVPVLEKLYNLLYEERSTDEELMRNFVIAKNRIMSDYIFGVKELKKVYIEKPRKERASKEEAREKAGAETILKQI